MRPFSERQDTDLTAPEGFLRSYNNLAHFQQVVEKCELSHSAEEQLLELAKQANASDSTVFASGEPGVEFTPNQLKTLGFPLLARYKELVEAT